MSINDTINIYIPVSTYNLYINIYMNIYKYIYNRDKSAYMGISAQANDSDFVRVCVRARVYG